VNVTMMHPSGTFCTALLHTRDVASSGRFYGAVFDWELREDDTGTSFTLHGQRVAGVSRTPDGDNLWVPYVLVDCASETRENAVRAGASVVDGSAQEGSRTLIRDPDGAVFGLCGPDEPLAATVMQQPGAIWWVEVLTHLPDALERFYADLLQWQFTEQPLDPHPRYVTWTRAGQAVGGLLPIGEGWQARPRWQVLFQVEHLEHSVARVIAAGGAVEFGPLDVPRAGRLTSVRDPLGALHVLAEPRSRTV